jgi:hypothetical protein
MYGQMWGNIDRHILVIWQSVATLFSAFAVLALIEKKVISLDLACTLLVLICAWVGAHVVDSNYWFARNIHIIANIEPQFLVPNDGHLIHPYFAADHKPRMLDHLVVQAYLAGGVFLLIVGWHLSERVAPGLRSPWNEFEILRALPYIVAAVNVALLRFFWRKQRARYADLLRKSPGASVTNQPPTAHRP